MPHWILPPPLTVAARKRQAQVNGVFVLGCVCDKSGNLRSPVELEDSPAKCFGSKSPGVSAQRATYCIFSAGQKKSIKGNRSSDHNGGFRIWPAGLKAEKSALPSVVHGHGSSCQRGREDDVCH